MDVHAKQHSQDLRKDHDDALKAENAASLATARPLARCYARLKLFRGSLTDCGADCLVNAANEGLQGGGGVDGLLHALASGSASASDHTPQACPLCAEVMARFPADATGARLATGCAVTTRAYNIPGARTLVHTVGPYLDAAGRPQHELLGACYRSSLAQARAAGAEVVAFPAISTGYYGFPMAEAGRVAIEAVSAYFEGDAAGGWAPQVLLTAVSQLQGDILEALLGGSAAAGGGAGGGAAAAGGSAP